MNECLKIWRAVLGCAAVFLLASQFAAASGEIRSICPAAGVAQAGAGFGPGGIILTAFDGTALWVYNVDNGRRYPLPDTRPCGRSCRLSPDFRWLSYFNNSTNAFNRMRLDGTQRRLIIEYAADIEWWSDDTFLIWTPGHQAYILTDGSAERQYLDVSGVISVQPNGRWGLLVEQYEDHFLRALINLELRGMTGISNGRTELGEDRAYFNAQAWSPNGEYLAYVAPLFSSDGMIRGSEIFGIAPGSAPEQWTQLSQVYGPTRVNGLAVGELSWSPDSTRIAFWVIPLLNGDPEGMTGEAMLHILDRTDGSVQHYCAFTTNEHTPNPPRLVWSPDGTHLAFSGNIPNDDQGYLLLALNVETGQLSALSSGVFPALGAPNVIAWGMLPG